MALYLGNQKVMVNLGHSLRIIKFYPAGNTVSGIRLITFDDYVLKDADGLYITVKKEDD